MAHLIDTMAYTGQTPWQCLAPTTIPRYLAASSRDELDHRAEQRDV